MGVPRPITSYNISVKTYIYFRVVSSLDQYPRGRIIHFAHNWADQEEFSRGDGGDGVGHRVPAAHRELTRRLLDTYILGGRSLDPNCWWGFSDPIIGIGHSLRLSPAAPALYSTSELQCLGFEQNRCVSTIGNLLADRSWTVVNFKSLSHPDLQA